MEKIEALAEQAGLSREDLLLHLLNVMSDGVSELQEEVEQLRAELRLATKGEAVAGNQDIRADNKLVYLNILDLPVKKSTVKRVQRSSGGQKAKRERELNNPDMMQARAEWEAIARLHDEYIQGKGKYAGQNKTAFFRAMQTKFLKAKVSDRNVERNLPSINEARVRLGFERLTKAQLGASTVL